MPKVKETVVFHDQKDFLVAFDLEEEDDKVFKISGPAKGLFLEISQGRSVSDYLKKLSEKEDVSLEGLEKLADGFIRKMTELGILTEK